MEYLYEYGLFLAKALTMVVAILVVAAGLLSFGQRHRTAREGHIEIRKLNEKYRHIDETIREAITDEAEFKRQYKAQKKADKQKAKLARGQTRAGADEAPGRKRLYVLNFDGDLRASATDHLREEVSAVLPLARKGDEILLCLESPGGVVHGYGLAASQLRRVGEAGVPLTVAVDKVAASGGYMMACVAARIIAAPFAVIGSIGVLAQLPNFHRLLKRHDIDFELLTAGEYKRTLTLFGENTDKGRSKFMEDLERTHALFKDFVRDNRPALDIDRVATGEVWYGQEAMALGLVDELKTSDAFVQERLADWDVFDVRFVHKKSWQEKLGLAAEGSLDRALGRLLQRATGPLV